MSTRAFRLALRELWCFPSYGIHVFWRQMTFPNCATNPNQRFSHIYRACPVRSFVGQNGKKWTCLKRKNGLDSLCFSLAN